MIMAEKVYLVIRHEGIYNDRAKIDDSYEEALAVFSDFDEARSWVEKQAAECHPNMKFEWDPHDDAYEFWWRSDDDRIFLTTRYYLNKLDFYN